MNCELRIENEKTDRSGVVYGNPIKRQIKRKKSLNRFQGIPYGHQAKGVLYRLLGICGFLSGNYIYIVLHLRLCHRLQ